MRAHCEIGYRMLAHLQFLAKALPVVRHHHERYDGAGYPDGLAGAQIPLLARVFAVADTFDAMTSDRPYRAACSPSTALEEVRRCSGTQFDPLIVDAFCRVPLAELERVAGSRAPQPETGTREVAMGSEAPQSPRHVAVLGADA